MKKYLTDEEMENLRTYIRRRDIHANLLGQATIAFEKEKAYRIQAIELLNDDEQRFMAEVARKNDLDPNKEYTVNYKTGEIHYKGEADD